MFLCSCEQRDVDLFCYAPSIRCRRFVEKNPSYLRFFFAGFASQLCAFFVSQTRNLPDTYPGYGVRRILYENKCRNAVELPQIFITVERWKKEQFKYCTLLRRMQQEVNKTYSTGYSRLTIGAPYYLRIAY